MFPEVQNKAQEEMDRVVGRERMPSIEDIDNLPYLRAVINEVSGTLSTHPTHLKHSFADAPIPPCNTYGGSALKHPGYERKSYLLFIKPLLTR